MRLVEPRETPVEEDKKNIKQEESDFSRGTSLLFGTTAIFSLYFGIGTFESMIAPVCEIDFGMNTVQISGALGVSCVLLVMSNKVMTSYILPKFKPSNLTLILIGSLFFVISQIILVTIATGSMTSWSFWLMLCVFMLSVPFLNFPSRVLTYEAVPGTDPSIVEGFNGVLSAIAQLVGPYYFVVTFQHSTGSIFWTALGLVISSSLQLAVQVIRLWRQRKKEPTARASQLFTGLDSPHFQD